MNSVAGGTRHSIASVSQAIVVLGRRQLQRWLKLLLFTLQAGLAYPSSLLLLAATRGKLMELLAARQKRTVDYCDEAFMACILLLIDTLIDKPLPEIAVELHVGDRIAAALLRRESELGTLLQLVESVEPADLTEAEIEAMGWANQIAEATA